MIFYIKLEGEDVCEVKPGSDYTVVSGSRRESYHVTEHTTTWDLENFLYGFACNFNIQTRAPTEMEDLAADIKRALREELGANIRRVLKEDS